MIIEYIPTEVENVKKTFFNYDRHLVTNSNSSVIFLFSSLFLMHLHLPHTWLWSELSHLKVRTFSGAVFFCCVRSLSHSGAWWSPGVSYLWVVFLPCGVDTWPPVSPRLRFLPLRDVQPPQPLSFLSQPLPSTEDTQGLVLNLPPTGRRVTLL